MVVNNLNVLVYNGKEVGYRLDLDAILVDVSKEHFDRLGGVNYTDVDYIPLYDSGSLIASEEEIKTGVYVKEVIDKYRIEELYKGYKNYLFGRLISDKHKYVVTKSMYTVGEDKTKGMPMVVVSK